MKKHIHYFLGVLLLLVSACKEKTEIIPAYLQIEPFTVNAEGGAAWQKITDGWLYVNGEFLGAYTLPATVPILAEGLSEVQVYPGVKQNGLLETPNIYSFLKRYDQNYTLTAGQTTVVQPVTSYVDNALYGWDFSRGSFDGGLDLAFEDRDTDNATGKTFTTVGAFAGESLLLKVDTAHALIEIATEEVLLPITGAKETWVEFHYRNDIPFELWLLGKTGSSAQENNQAIYSFNETENWNKIYFNLTEFLVATQLEKNRLFFRVPLPRDTNGKYKLNQGTVRLDNIRILHF